MMSDKDFVESYVATMIQKDGSIQLCYDIERDGFVDLPDSTHFVDEEMAQTIAAILCEDGTKVKVVRFRIEYHDRDQIK